MPKAGPQVSQDLAARLPDLVADAAAGLDRASGAAAVCTWSRAGIPVPGIKYAEGRWAALREVERAVRRGVEPAAAAARALGIWDAALTALSDRDAGRDWIAYRTGGVDALRDLLG